MGCCGLFKDANVTVAAWRNVEKIRNNLGQDTRLSGWDMNWVRPECNTTAVPLCYLAPWSI